MWEKANMRNTAQDLIVKDVHWYLMMSDSYHSRPQREEYFVDSGVL